MILLEQASGVQGERLFPVYTWHVDELLALQNRTEQVLARHPEDTDDERIPKIRRLRERLAHVANILLYTFGDVAYLNAQDRNLVQKAASYLQEHPEK